MPHHVAEESLSLRAKLAVAAEQADKRAQEAQTLAQQVQVCVGTTPLKAAHAHLFFRDEKHICSSTWPTRCHTAHPAGNWVC